MTKSIKLTLLALVLMLSSLLSCQDATDAVPKQRADLATLQKAIFATKEYHQIMGGISEHLIQVNKRVKSLSLEDQELLQKIRRRYTTVKELVTQVTPTEKAALVRIFSTPLPVDIYGLSKEIERQLAVRYEFTKEDFARALTTRSTSNARAAQSCSDAASDHYYYMLRVLIEDYNMAPAGPETVTVADLYADAYYQGCIAGGGQP